MPQSDSVIWGFYPGKHEGASGDFGATSIFRVAQLVGLGWPETGNLTSLAGRKDALPVLVDGIRETYRNEPDIASWSLQKQEAWFRRSAGVVYRFLCEAKPSDIVVYACKIDRQVHIGRIRDDADGRYWYDEAQEAHQRIHWHFRHFRAVIWLKSVPYSECSEEELAKARTQNTFWRMKGCPAKFQI